VRVLVADDESVAREAVSRFMQAYGECLTAEGSREACEVYRKAWEAGRPMDLVFINIFMQGGGGQQALEQIRRFERDKGLKQACIIAVFSELDDPMYVVSAFSAGASAYLVKPIQEKRLEEELDRLGFTQGP